MTEPQPKIVKRYSNRKLYDTSDSCYVTLEDIAEMVRQGEDVKVIDNSTKRDITSITLSQIIFEEQRRNKSSLPLNTFKQLIQVGGESIKELLQKTLDSKGSNLEQVKQFYDVKIKPALQTVPQLPELREEIVSLQKRIASMERKFREMPILQTNTIGQKKKTKKKK